MAPPALRSARTVLVLIGLAAAACAPPALVREGWVEGVIVAPTAGNTDDVLAGKELQAYLQKITGLSVPIYPQASKAKAMVRVGVYGKPPVQDWNGAAPPADGFAIETRGNVLWIVGGDARGTLHGVYDVLETDLGVRWFMPGDLGEDVPETKTVLLPVVKREG